MFCSYCWLVVSFSFLFFFGVVFNATFNNIPVVSWRLVLLMEVAVSFIDGGHRTIRRQPPICRKSLTNFMVMVMCFLVHVNLKMAHMLLLPHRGRNGRLDGTTSGVHVATNVCNFDCDQ